MKVVPGSLNLARHPRKTVAFVAFCTLLGINALCQAAGPDLAPQQHRFEVASVRLIGADQRDVARGRSVSPGYFRYAGASLEDLIRYAYGIAGFQPISGGPSWLRSDGPAVRFVVEARYPAATDPKLVPAMMQSLLAERFNLALHTRPIQAEVYELRVGHGIPKLKAHESGTPIVPAPCPADIADYRPMRDTHAGPVSVLVDVLAKYYKLAVIDKTGLSGSYTFSFCYPIPNRVPPPAGLPPPPSIQAAIEEQLGLRLTPGKGTVLEYIVDHGELPRAN
ncbi:MAG TPA: TIGR03435 family protein [Terriglobales bacterium]|nr:TIGR03435 family protein [Terriglobales bacterium]